MQIPLNQSLPPFPFHFKPRMEAIEEQITERAELLDAKRTQMNRVEDEVFSDFCGSIGVENIRQYEEKELRAQQERAKKRLEFENQKSRLGNQLEYERSRDTEGNYDCGVPVIFKYIFDVHFVLYNLFVLSL